MHFTEEGTRNLSFLTNSSQEQVSTAMGFQAIGGFPRVLGAIDGTHVAIKGPTEDEDAYVNRKNFHSLAVQVGLYISHLQ